jgi:hypothetical protein
MPSGFPHACAATPEGSATVNLTGAPTTAHAIFATSGAITFDYVCH